MPNGVAKMAAFDDALIAHHLSPGGTADLLGVTWFLAQLPQMHEGVGARHRGSVKAVQWQGM
jgi:triphosphoribosyl-dephospho-CoA synthetase